MSKLVGLLGRKPAAPDKHDFVPDNGLDLDEELFSALGTRMGGDNETLRNLLLDAGYKIGELDEIKATITRLIEPVGKTLRAFEAEKAEKVGLLASLNSARADLGKLHEDFLALDKKSTASAGECAQLRQDLAASNRAVATVESAKAELTEAAAAARARIAELETRLTQETAESRRLREDGKRLDERLIAADRRIGQIESELTATRQKLSMAENEKRTLQLSLEKTIAEAARVSRRLQESENTLAAAQARLRQVESHYADINNERARLSSALEEAGERHQSESAAHKTRMEAMTSRVAASEKILVEAREQLMGRADEVRKLERQVSELTLARDTLENTLGAAEIARGDADAKNHEIEQARAVLHERNAALTRALGSKDIALQRADEQIAALTENLSALHAQMEINRQTAARDLEDAKAALNREKVERAMAEGALEAGRKDLARVMREVMALQRRQTAQEAEPRLVSANAA